MSAEPVHKLPKWAQTRMEDLQRQRDTAVQALKEWSDTQTPQPISISEFECLESGAPTHMTRYIEGRRITVKWKGVELSVTLQESDSAHEDGIGLQWGSTARGMERVAMVPTSFQSVALIAKENMQR